MTNKYEKIAKFIDKNVPVLEDFPIKGNFDDMSVETMEIIKKKKDVLTADEILKYSAHNESNEAIQFMLLECKNVPFELIRRVYNNHVVPSDVHKDGSKLYTFWSIDFNREVVKNNIPFFVESFHDLPSARYRKFNFSDALAFECAKETFYSPITTGTSYNANYIFLSNMKAGKSVSQKEFNDTVLDMIERNDIEGFNDKFSAILSNPNIPQEVLDEMFSPDKELSVKNMCEYCPASQIETTFENLIAATFDSGNKSALDWNTTEAFIAFVFNPNSTGGMINDLFNRLISEGATGLYIARRIATQVMWGGWYAHKKPPKDLPDEVWYKMFEVSDANFRKYMMSTDKVPEELKVKCCEYYFELTKRKKLGKSASVLINTLGHMIPVTTLPEKRYEQVEEQKNDNFINTVLREKMKESPNTPMKYLKIYKSEDKHDIRIDIAMFCNKNGLSHDTALIIKEALDRDYEGDKKKFRINAEIIGKTFEKVGNKMPELIEFFDKYSKSKGIKTKEQKTFIKHMSQFKQCYNDYLSCNKDTDLYFKTFHPKAYFEGKQKEAVDKMVFSNNESFSFLSLFDNMKKYEKEFFSANEQKNCAIRESKKASKEDIGFDNER